MEDASLDQHFQGRTDLHNYISDSNICNNVDNTDVLNPILGGLLNYVTGQGRAIMARMDSRDPEAVCRYSKA